MLFELWALSFFRFLSFLPKMNMHNWWVSNDYFLTLLLLYFLYHPSVRYWDKAEVFKHYLFKKGRWRTYKNNVQKKKLCCNAIKNATILWTKWISRKCANIYARLLVILLNLIEWYCRCQSIAFSLKIG